MTAAWLFLAMVVALCGWRSIVFLLPPPRDKRPLAERNWEWVMGPELPATCTLVGHTYEIDQNECDWCGAERYVEFVQHPEHVPAELAAAAERFTIVGQPEPIWIAPARIAGKYLDLTPDGVVHSSVDEARTKAKEEAARRSERSLAERRTAARWNARHQAPETSWHYSPPSYPRRPELVRARTLYSQGLISRDEYRHILELDRKVKYYR